MTTEMRKPWRGIIISDRVWPIPVIGLGNLEGIAQQCGGTRDGGRGHLVDNDVCLVNG